MIVFLIFWRGEVGGGGAEVCLGTRNSPEKNDSSTVESFEFSGSNFVVCDGSPPYKLTSTCMTNGF